MPIAQTRVLNALTANGGTYRGISALARAASPNHYLANIQRRSSDCRHVRYPVHYCGGDGMTLKEAAALLGVSTHLARSILELDEYTRASDNLDAETTAYVINSNYHEEGDHNVLATR